MLTVGRGRGMPKKQIITVAVIFIVVAVSIFSGFSLYVFSSPKNCKVCHFIEPYYKKWETSTHNMVKCTKCHEYSSLNAISGQLRLLIGTYNPRPMTHVPDKNCLQSACHDKRFVESNTRFTKRGIDFDHKPHFKDIMRGKKLHCRSCHSDIVQGEHMKVSKNVCYLCHFKGLTTGETLSGCPSCHSAPRNEIMHDGKPFSHTAALDEGIACNVCHINVIKGTGAVSKEKCFFCHIDHEEMYGDVEFVHDKHVGDKQLDCLYCHEKIEHGKINISEGI